MKTDREKLIELISSTEYGNGSLIGKNFQRGFIEKIADHLISNGVTFAKDTDVPSKWIGADHPPENWKGEGGYLTNFYVYTPEYGVDIGNYMKPANKWLCMGIPCNVTHWMPLPEPSKEDGK